MLRSVVPAYALLLLGSPRSTRVLLLAVQQRLVLLLPQDAEQLRDRGLTWAELGRPAEAADDLSAYLSARPDAADAPALRERLAELQRGGAPRPL